MRVHDSRWLLTPLACINIAWCVCFPVGCIIFEEDKVLKIDMLGCRSEGREGETEKVRGKERET